MSFNTLFGKVPEDWTISKIGDIADAALSEVAKIKAKEETRRANANASESKGSN